MENQASRYQDLFENAVIGIYQTSTAGEILRANAALAGILGYDSVEDLLSSQAEFESQVYIEPGRRSDFLMLMQTYGAVSQFVSKIRSRDGRIIWISDSARTVRDKAGNPLFYEGFVVDITASKELEKSKSDFISFAAHLLRTPLAGIKWLLELCADEETSREDIKLHIDDARASTEKLINLVNNLLDVSKMENQGITSEMLGADLAVLTKDSLNRLDPLIREKSLQVSVDIEHDLPPAFADPDWLQRAIHNLVLNAVQYTPGGGDIAVRIGREKDYALWQIRDSGIGIPPEAKARLFEKFFRAENAFRVETDNAGLGLYLARLVIEHSGGQLSYTSKEGQGSTFRFTVPFINQA